MIQEARILLRIKKLQQSWGGVTLHTTPYLVNLKNKMGRVLCVKRNEMLQWVLVDGLKRFSKLVSRALSIDSWNVVKDTCWNLDANNSLIGLKIG